MRIDGASEELEVAVQRFECASGVTGEVLPIEVTYDEDQIVITAAVARTADVGGNCQENAPVPVAVQLEEPIGDRELVDGGCTEYPDLATSQLCVDPVRWAP